MKLFVLSLSFMLTNVLFMIQNANIQNLETLKRIKAKSFWFNKTFINKKYEILVFGNSRIYRGINPLKDSKGRKIYNLGYSSAGLSPQILDNYITKNLAKNGIILIGISPGLFEVGAFKNEHWMEFYSSTTDRVILNKNLKISKLLSPYKRSNYIKGPQLSYYEDFNSKTGFVGSRTQVYDTDIALASYREHFKRHQF